MGYCHQQTVLPLNSTQFFNPRNNLYGKTRIVEPASIVYIGIIYVYLNFSAIWMVEITILTFLVWYGIFLNQVVNRYIHLKKVLLLIKSWIRSCTNSDLTRSIGNFRNFGDISKNWQHGIYPSGPFIHLAVVCRVPALGPGKYRCQSTPF